MGPVFTAVSRSNVFGLSLRSVRGDFSMLRRVVLLAASVAGICLLPTLVFAQAGIAGNVKDSSGAVLPGVTVEAASPALIEKTRSVVTDGNGNYKIENVRPGTYSVTCTLPGFNTV